MTFITWVAYVQKTYTKQVEYCLFAFGFCQNLLHNKRMAPHFLSNPVIKGVEWHNFTNYYEWIRFY